MLVTELVPTLLLKVSLLTQDVGRWLSCISIQGASSSGSPEILDRLGNALSRCTGYPLRDPCGVR